MRTFVLITLLIGCHSTFFAQNTALFTNAICKSTCSGTLGENIFPDGDFGSGTPNILPGNPGIAPGYNYIQNPPPGDGSYVITNNTSSWGSFAANNWIKIQDNGPEPNGYMMVVNAAFQPGIFYQKTVPVCENTLYEMSVDVISMVIKSLASTHIAPNVAFFIDGQEVCATGEVASDELWHTYRFSFTTQPGTNSVNLSFRNKAPGGYGNDLAIDNIAFRACGPMIQLPDTVHFCAGKALELNANFSNSPYNSPVYQWQISNDMGLTWQNIPGANTPTLTVNAPNTSLQYSLLTANSNNNLSVLSCRVRSESVPLQLDDLSKFRIAGPDTIVCNGAPAILEAGQQKSFIWSDGSTQPTLTTSEPGWYSVSILSEHNCPARDSIFVQKINLSADVSAQKPTCSGDTDGVIEIGNRQGGVGNLRYQLNNGSAQNSPLFSELAGGQYTVFITDSLGCQLEKTVDLSDPAPFQVNIGPETPVEACTQISLYATTNYPPVHYQWTGLVDCTDCPTPSSMPLRDTLYTLTVTDQQGCTGSDSLWLRVNPIIDLYAPNVFAPGSEDNGFFSIFTSKSAISVRHFAIFDRWGNLIMEVRNQVPDSKQLRWDGTVRDKTGEQGVYIWMAEIDYGNGRTQRYGGDVLLLR